MAASNGGVSAPSNRSPLVQRAITRLGQGRGGSATYKRLLGAGYSMGQIRKLRADNPKVAADRPMASPTPVSSLQALVQRQQLADTQGQRRQNPNGQYAATLRTVKRSLLANKPRPPQNYTRNV